MRKHKPTRIGAGLRIDSRHSGVMQPGENFRSEKIIESPANDFVSEEITPTNRIIKRSSAQKIRAFREDGSSSKPPKSIRSNKAQL